MFLTWCFSEIKFELCVKFACYTIFLLSHCHGVVVHKGSIFQYLMHIIANNDHQNARKFLVLFWSLNML